MPQDYARWYHEMALLPVEHETFLFTSCQNSFQVEKARVKGIAEDGQIIHKHFHIFLDHVAENAHHAPLKGGRRITQSKWHTPEGISTKRTSESSLFLILQCNLDLIIT